MKNFYFLAFFIFISQFMVAQIKFQNADGPKRDQRYVHIPADNNKTKYYGASTKSGADQIWDFTGFNFDTNAQIKQNVYSMSGVPFSNLYPRATISVGDNPKKDSMWTIMERASTGLFILGTIDVSGPLVFSNGLMVNPYPMTYGLNYSDKDTVKLVIDMDTAAIIFNLNGDVDGWGTIKTKDGDRTCLRTKAVQKQEIYLSGLKFGETTDTRYEWWTNGNGFPICEYTISSSIQFGTSQIDTSVYYSPRLIGVGSHDLQIEEISISPNPAQLFTIVKLPDVPFNSIDLRLIDINGKIAKHDIIQSSDQQQRINLQGIQKGVYLLQTILDKNVSYFTKLIIE